MRYADLQSLQPWKVASLENEVYEGPFSLAFLPDRIDYSKDLILIFAGNSGHTVGCTQIWIIFFRFFNVDT